MVSALCVALVVVAQNNKEELAEVLISNGFYSALNFEWILFTPQIKVGSLAGVLTSVEASMTRQGVLTVLLQR